MRPILHHTAAHPFFFLLLRLTPPPPSTPVKFHPYPYPYPPPLPRAPASPSSNTRPRVRLRARAIAPQVLLWSNLENPQVLPRSHRKTHMEKKKKEKKKRAHTSYLSQVTTPYSCPAWSTYRPTSQLTNTIHILQTLPWRKTKRENKLRGKKTSPQMREGKKRGGNFSTWQQRNEPRKGDRSIDGSQSCRET